jgi:hypothetical protein
MLITLQSKPNPAVKGTHQPFAVLKVCFLVGFGSFAWRLGAARPLPLRYTISTKSLVRWANSRPQGPINEV